MQPLVAALRLFDATQPSAHVLECPTGSASGAGGVLGLPFSLVADSSNAQIALAPSALRGGGFGAMPLRAVIDGTLDGFDGAILASPAQEGLSQSFSVEAVGNEASLEMGDADGGAVELALHIATASGKLAAAGATVAARPLRDPQPRRRAAAVAAGADAAREAHVDQGGGELLAADGSPTSLRWAKAAAPRRIMLKPRGRTHEWCAPFSPETVGEHILKLRPAATADAAAAAAAGGGGGDDEAGTTADDPEVMYLRLTVTMEGSRRELLLRPAVGGEGGGGQGGGGQGALRLPYRIVNDSALLLAFKQQGSAHWDLLGAGEACDTALDLPQGMRALQLAARDPCAEWRVEQRRRVCASIGSTNRCPSFASSRGRVAAVAAAAAAAAATAETAAQRCLPPPLEPVLLSVSARLRYGAERLQRRRLAVPHRGPPHIHLLPRATRPRRRRACRHLRSGCR